MKTFYKDRETIESKYHLKGEWFDPFKRMAGHGYPYDESTGLSDEEILCGLHRLESELSGLAHPVAKAKAIRFVLENTRIDVNASDYFVGFYSLNRLASGICAGKWEAELNAGALKEAKQLMDDLCASNAASIWPDFDHMIPDWDSILTLGFQGLKERASTYRALHRTNGTLTDEMDAHFEGIEILFSAILDVIDRLYQFAKTGTHEKAEAQANCLYAIRHHAPSNMYEAMQVMYIYFIISECFDNYQVRSLGNGLDRSLYPFYKNDIENGTYTREELREFIAYFLMQWSAIGNYWGQPFYLGGTNTDGTTKYNALSVDILDVYDTLDIYNPKIQLKVNESTPDDILNKACDMIRRGHSSITFCCEPAMLEAVMRYGASYEEALDMDISGCYELHIRANEVSSATGYINALKPIEYIFTNGYDQMLGRDFGMKTGTLSELDTFDAFYKAVLTQWGAVIDKVIEAANVYEAYFSYMNPSITYSATIEESLKSGKDAYQNGVKYNNSLILNCGIASLVDSVMVVKELVYDTRTVTLDELKAALDANWEGYEDLRTMALKSKHKYGNGDEDTDRYAKALSLFFAERVQKNKNARGGVYKAEMHSARQFVEQGKCMPATPDGRKYGEEIAKNASPSIGMDKNGVTALINSVLQMQPSAYSEGFCLDVMLHPTAIRGEEGLAIMKSLLLAYMRGGGMTIQFNVFDFDMLKDAQAHPERYQNLQVRVCGWNVLWANMAPSERNAYIARAEGLTR